MVKMTKVAKMAEIVKVSKLVKMVQDFVRKKGLDYGKDFQLKIT